MSNTGIDLKRQINKMPSVLITGADGFTGRNLTEALSKKHEVLSLRHSELDLLNSKQTQDIFKNSPSIHTVIHCAVVGGSRISGSTAADGADVVEKNLRMFNNIIRCLRPNQRLIHLGSGAEYDRRHYQPKISEDFFDQDVPEDSYGFAKYMISKHIEKMSNAICLRIFGLYGQYEDYRWKFISNAIIKNLLGLPITIVRNVMFDYLYIRDFVQLVERIMGQDSWPYRHINITPNESIDLLSLAQMINEVSDKPSEIRVLNAGWSTPYTGTNQRLLNMVGPFSFTSYVEGIRELTAYYRQVFDMIDIELIENDPYLKHCQASNLVTTHE